VRAVRTRRGTIATDCAVIATGTFSDVLAATAGFEIGITCVKRQRLILPDVPEVPPDAPMTIDEENGAHWRPALGGGANLMFTQAGVPPGPPLEDVPPSDDFAFGLLDPSSAHAVARIVPFWRDVWARHSSGWVIRAGQYDYTFDHRPMIGRSPVDGLWVNTGYSGHGIMASAGGSRLLVDLVTGRATDADNPFRLDRPREERALDVI
jgi:glycine/D-amino acid oxidase-like deaminating enzyme